LARRRDIWRNAYKSAASEQKKKGLIGCSKENHILPKI